MGKYKQWLHHQEVGARLRDEIAAHEAERERVLKLAPTRPTSLPDVSNPLIAALLGQKQVAPAAAPAGKAAVNGAATASAVTEAPAKTGTAASAPPGSQASAAAPAASAAASVSKASPVIEKTARAETPAPQDDSKAAKPKVATPSEPIKDKPANTSAAPAQASASAAQPDTIDPLLAQLLAQAENAPDDPLEALNLLASQGPNLTRGEAPQPIASTPSSPFTAPPPAGPSAISTLMGETPKAPEAKTAEAEPVTAPLAVGVETASSTVELTVRTEGTLKVEKGRSETDELVAARPTEGYTEPRLIVPQWLKSMELGQEAEGGEKSGEDEDAESKQRFSVSLPFENEEDMRLHESVERWWQRWRQQS